jgi:FdhD protein
MNEVKQDGWEIIRFHGTEAIRMEEEIVQEFPLTIILNGEEFATMVCSPTNLEELIIGFLASEGIIRLYEEIKDISIDDNLGFAYVELYKSIDLSQKDYSKRFIGSCCGKSRQFYFKNDVRTAKTIASRLSISVEQCYNLMRDLQLRSEQFRRTGGVHNAALATPVGLLEVRTDIGRHNALDKVYGTVLQQKIPLQDKLIVFSGRISSEVLLKISKIGVGILLSNAAPTDLALNLANDLGITVIGFARDNKMNVYTHPSRIQELNMESCTN